MTSTTLALSRLPVLRSIGLPRTNAGRLMQMLALLSFVLAGLPAAHERAQLAVDSSSPKVVTRQGESTSLEPVDAWHGQQLYVSYCQACHGDRQGRGKIPNAPFHGPGGHTWAHPD